MGTFPQHNLKIYIVTFIRQSRLSLAYTTKKMYINLYEPSMHGFYYTKDFINRTDFLIHNP